MVLYIIPVSDNVFACCKLCVYSVLVGIWSVTFYYAVAQAVRSLCCSHFSASLALLLLVCCRVGIDHL